MGLPPVTSAVFLRAKLFWYNVSVSRNIWDASATPSELKSEWYVCSVATCVLVVSVRFRIVAYLLKFYWFWSVHKFKNFFFMQLSLAPNKYAYN
jgi:hypothetical protein